MKRRKTSTQPMLKIGITGGIGSGKTTACKVFETLGVPVYYADDRAKYLMQHEHHLIDEIKKNFGNEVYKDGQLDRKLLAQKVFSNKSLLQTLNGIVHPAVFHDTEWWIEKQKALNRPYILKEAALLVESGSYKQLDKLIVVTAPCEMRMQRVSQRDQVEIEEVMQRVRHQLSEEEKIKLADFVIVNDKDIHHLQTEVEKLHTKIMKLAAK